MSSLNDVTRPRPQVTRVAPERRHTLYFLEEVRRASPVFLDTDVDMTAVRAHRSAFRLENRRYSVVSYVLLAAAQVLARHPQANAAVQGRYRIRVARYPDVHGKLALDKAVGGHRVVLSAVLPHLDRASLDDIQALVDTYRDGDPALMAEFDGVRLLHRLPGLLGRAAFRMAVRPLRLRHTKVGTFAVTSLGHRAVDGFYSVGGTTITLGVGRITDRPVARDGAVEIAPLMRLSLTFDHRVIDGAEAADVLTEIKDALEGFGHRPDTEASAAAPELARSGER